MTQHLDPLEQNPTLSSDPTGTSIFTNQVRPDTSKHSVQEDMEKESNRTKRDDHEDAEDSAQRNADPNIVNWDGPNDAANPQNWSKRVRIGHVALISVITLVTNLAFTMFAPGAASLMQEFHQTSATLGTLVVTMYFLGFVLGPLAIVPLSELHGRLYICHASNVIFLGTTIGCALSTNVVTFLAFRFLAGFAGSAPLVHGGGTVADVMPREKRGVATAIFAAGSLLGPLIGPSMGVFISSRAGWRWTFWVLSIFSGTVSIAALIFVRETYAPVLLKSKAARLSVERSNRLLVAKGDSGLTPTALFARSIVRPVEMPVFSSIVLALCIFSALEVGLTHLPFTTFPSVFQEQYGFTTGITGLSYLGLGIGMTFGLALFNVFSGRMLKTRAGRAVMKPEYRLSRMVYFTPIPHVVFLWYGWSANAEVHLIVPILGTPVIGLGSLLVIMLAQSYFVDAFGPYAASALAMKLILLSLFLTSSLLAGPYLYNSRRRMGG